MVGIIYLGVIGLGLLHGLEPGHGWPIAIIYASKSTKPLPTGIVSSLIISFFHLLSSVAVVLAYILIVSITKMEIPYVNLIAGCALIMLAIRFWMESKKDKEVKENLTVDGIRKMKVTHNHDSTKVSFKGLISIAFILGFAHEEEFAILALAVGGIDPLLLMISYAISVTISIVAITTMGMLMFSRFKPTLDRYRHVMPKISALVLLALGLSFILGIR